MSIGPAIGGQQGVGLPSNPVLKKKPILKDQAGTPMQSTMDEPMQTPMPSSQQIKPTQGTAGQAQIGPSIGGQMPLINKPLIQGAPQTQATNFPEKVQQGIAQDIKVKQESRIPIEVSLSKSIADFSADIQKNGDISVEDINKFYPELKGREKSLADLSADIQKNGDISMEELQQYYPELLKAKETTIEGVYNKIKDKLAIAAPIVFPLTSLMLKGQEMAQEGLKGLTGKSTIGFVDPAFKYLSMDEINADNEKKIKDKDIGFVGQQMLKQSAPIEFMFENFGRLLNNVPSAVANTVIFATNILLDPETTIKEFVDGISALPAVVREQMSYADTTVDKIKTVVDGILGFVVENPDIIIAPEVLMKGSKLLKGRGPKMADISIQEEVLRRMKSKGMDVTPENVAKESNLLYDELMEESNKAPDAEQSDVDAYSNIYEGIDQKGELAQRPDIDYRTQIPTIEKDIQQIFGPTGGGVNKPTDIAKKTDAQISTIETILDNKDNLWDLFDTEGKVMKDMSVSMLAVGVQNTMDNFYQNFVTPIESSLSELKVKPSDTDIDWIIKSIDKSLDEMRIGGQVSPLAEKAFNVLSKYKEILSGPIQVSDLWKLSKELNQATKQLYGGATLGPATQILQSNLAGLNVIVRDIYEGVVSNILDVPELKTMKRQRGDMRNSIKQITRRGQVLDRKAPMTLVDSLGHAFGLGEIVIGALSQDPLLIVKGVALKAIVNHIKNLNSPNKQLYKLINKIDKSRNGFKVEGGFSEGSTAAEGMKRKMKKQVRKTQEEAAQKARMDKIQRDFANRMKQIQDTPALTVGVIEIMADGTIKQQAIAPKPRIQSVVEIDTVTPQKERQRLAAEKKIVDNEKSMIEAEKKMGEMAKQMIEKKEAMAQDMLYDYSAKNGTIVEGSDVFNGIKQGDVTKFGIVEKTVISGTKAQIYINGQTFMAGELGKVYRIANNPEKVLVKINNDIKQALDTNMTPATDEITEFLDGIGFNDPSQGAMVSMNGVDNFQTKAYSNAMTILEGIGINMEGLKPSKVINDMPRNLSEPIAKLVRGSYDNIDPALPEIKKMRDELNGNSDMEAGLKNMDEQSANEITARKDIDEVYKGEAKGFDDMMNEIDKKNIKELNEFKQQLEKDIDQPGVKDLIDEVNNDINKLEAKGLNDISEFYATNGISKLRQGSYNKYLSENEFKSGQGETLKERIDGISDLGEAQSYNEKEGGQSWAKIVFPDPEMPGRVTVITTNKYGKEYFDYVKNKYDPANTPKLETIKSKPKDLMDYAKKYKTYDKFYDAMLGTKSGRKMMNDINEYINGKDPELDIMDLKSDQLERFYKEATESKQGGLFDTTPQTDLMEEAPLPVSGSKGLKPKTSNLDIKQESAMAVYNNNQRSNSFNPEMRDTTVFNQKINESRLSDNPLDIGNQEQKILDIFRELSFGKKVDQDGYTRFSNEFKNSSDKLTQDMRGIIYQTPSKTVMIMGLKYPTYGEKGIPRFVTAKISPQGKLMGEIQMMPIQGFKKKSLFSKSKMDGTIVGRMSEDQISNANLGDNIVEEVNKGLKPKSSNMSIRQDSAMVRGDKEIIIKSIDDPNYGFTNKQKEFLRNPDIKLSEQGKDQVARERFDIPSLEKLSFGGSDRDVYALGDDKVLKVAKTARGLGQNMYADWYLGGDVIPNIIEKGDNYTVFERVTTYAEMTPSERKHINEFSKKLKDQGNKIKGYNGRLDYEAMDKTREILDEYEWGSLADFNLEDFGWNDLSPRNLGIKNGYPVLLDEGTINLVSTIEKYKGVKNLDDIEFKDIYTKSQKFKKLFGDIDSKTMYNIAGVVIPGSMLLYEMNSN